MLKTSTILSFFTVMLMLLSSCNSTQEKEQKSLFIILDGISADVLEMIDTPHLDDVIENGSYTRAWLGGEAGGYSESPTVSAVGYNHLITGVWSNKHNVYGNDIEDPNYNYWNLFRLFKENHPDKEVAIYSSWEDNRTKLAGHGLPEAGDLTIDIYHDGFELDTLAFPHRDDGTHIQDVDSHVADKAAESVREEAPYLSWVYLWYPDSAGHAYGDGPESYEALRVADEQIGRIWEAIQYREENYNEEWLFAVTTDHGRRLPDGMHHGGHTERERTVWFITNRDDHNLYFSASEPAIVDFYPTAVRFLDLDIPVQLEKELDGVPMIGEVSLSHPGAEFDGESETISLNWKAWEDSGEVEILITTENRFAEGEEDTYQQVAVEPVIAQQAEIDVSEIPSDFYKIVLKGEHNSVNRWIVTD
jgi:hypothetical protein